MTTDSRTTTSTTEALPALEFGQTWPTLDTFRELAADRRVIPVVRRLLADAETPLSLYRKLAKDRPGTFLLESAEHGGVWSRYSIVGAASRATLTERDGEAAARARFETSARRLLRTFFRCGLFEDPYLDPDVSRETVGRPDFVDAGYAAQLGGYARYALTIGVPAVGVDPTVLADIAVGATGA